METDPELKAKLEEEYKKYEGAFQEGSFNKQTIEDIVGPAGMPFDFVGNTVNTNPVNILGWIGKIKDILEDKDDAPPIEGGVTETDPSKKDPNLPDTDPTDPSGGDVVTPKVDPPTFDPAPADGAADTTDTTTGGAGADEDLGTGTIFEDPDQTGAGTGGAGTGTTGPTDEPGGGDADTIGDGTGAADTIGTGTGVSDTPGAGAGDVGDPGDVGEGTGTGVGTGTGTGGGTGSGTGTGSGEGAGEGSGTGTRFGSQQLMQLLQPRRVQVESSPVADIKRIYDISGRYIPIEQYRSPFGLPSLSTPPQRIRPMGFKRGGLVSQHTDNMSNYKEVGTVDDLLRILRDKR